MKVDATVRKRVRQAPEVRREGILDAAAQVFLDKGIAAATMDDVARSAGVAKGTVYLYFDSKEDLVTALQGRYAEELGRDVGVLLSVGRRGSRLRRLEAFIRGLATGSEERHRMYHVLFQDPRASDDAIIDEMRTHLFRFVRDGVEAGEFSVSDVELATEYVLQGIHGSLHFFHGPDGTRRVPSLLRLARQTLSP